MKKRNIHNEINNSENSEAKKITRKEALKKAGKYVALTATTLIILTPKSSQASSAYPAPPGW